MLVAQNLACLKGNRLLFRHLELVISPGQLWILKGPNGVGKTSLLRLLAGLATPEVGEVTWQKIPITRDRAHFHRALLYIGHHGALHDLLTPLENLRFTCQVSGDWHVKLGVDDERCIQALVRMGLGDRLDLPCRVLSQGQRRRVGLARLFLSAHRPLWILDEPFTALDVNAVADLAETLDTHCAAGGAVVLTTHQTVNFQTTSHCIDVGAFAC